MGKRILAFGSIVVFSLLWEITCLLFNFFHSHEVWICVHLRTIFCARLVHSYMHPHACIKVCTCAYMHKINVRMWLASMSVYFVCGWRSLALGTCYVRATNDNSARRLCGWVCRYLVRVFVRNKCSQGYNSSSVPLCRHLIMFQFTVIHYCCCSKFIHAIIDLFITNIGTNKTDYKIISVQCFVWITFHFLTGHYPLTTFLYTCIFSLFTRLF